MFTANMFTAANQKGYSTYGSLYGPNRDIVFANSNDVIATISSSNGAALDIVRKGTTWATSTIYTYSFISANSIVYGCEAAAINSDGSKVAVVASLPNSTNNAWTPMLYVFTWNGTKYVRTDFTLATQSTIKAAQSIAMSPDGTYILAGWDQGAPSVALYKWNGSTYASQGTKSRTVWGKAAITNTTALLMGGNYTSPGAAMYTYDLATWTAGSSPVYSLASRIRGAIGPDDTVYQSDEAGNIYVYQAGVSVASLTKPTGYSSNVFARHMQITQDGNYLAVDMLTGSTSVPDVVFVYKLVSGIPTGAPFIYTRGEFAYELSPSTSCFGVTNTQLAVNTYANSTYTTTINQQVVV